MATMKSAEERLLDSLFADPSWMPRGYQGPQQSNDQGIATVAKIRDESLKGILLVENEDDGILEFMNLCSAWVEATDEDERPTCEDDLAIIADRLLVSRNQISMRSDIWSIAMENPQAVYDWDKFFRMYSENKAEWLGNAVESLMVQKLMKAPTRV